MINNKLSIKETIHSIDLAIESEIENHEKRIKFFFFIKKQIRSICNHENTKYVPDASGNNDSYHYCLECGLEKKRF
jgi:hypothetical protein